MSRNRRQPYRSSSSLGRRTGKKEARHAILIVCEGKETEPRYFRALREAWQLGPLVEIEAVGRGHEATVREAIALRDRRAREASADAANKPPYDEVWCVFDRESEADSTAFEHAVKLAENAKKKALRLAVSNPAFEYWYLLHFEDTDRPFRDADEVTKALRRHKPDYEKNMDITSDLLDSTEIAIA